MCNYAPKYVLNMTSNLKPKFHMLLVSNNMSYITNMESTVADEGKDIKKGKVGTALGLVQSHCI